MSKVFLFFLLLILSSCGLPDPKKPPSAIAFEDYLITEDSLYLTVKKKGPGPAQISVTSTDKAVSTVLDTINPIILYGTTELRVDLAHQLVDTVGLRESMGGRATFGDPFAVWDTTLKYAWPFPKGKSYKIVQGYNGSFSHNSENSRYAIDFNLQVGDTVCAAEDGLVISILQENTIGGKKRKYRPYANYITLYHADGLITQYVHLVPHSALVKVGDQVEKGQPIGLSGKTGFTDGPHLHFNVYRPEIGKTPSAPILFEQTAGKDLKKGMRVSH